MILSPRLWRGLGNLGLNPIRLREQVRCDQTTPEEWGAGLTFPVSGARARRHVWHDARARVRVDWAVRQQDHSLKEVIAVGAVELAGKHATVLETGARNRRGMDRCGRAFREALYPRSRRDARV